MTLSTSTVLGNYTHSEPKFIGASPERKDYPISTENCDIKVTSQHAQPGTKITIGEPVQYTKSGVYISKITQPDFSIEFKTKTEQAARDFKIGDRVEIVNGKDTYVAGDVLGKHGTILDSGGLPAGEVLVSLCGEDNYRVFLLENVKLFVDDTTDTPFKFGMNDDVIIKTSGYVGNVVGRFAEHFPTHIDVTYELVGRNIIGRAKFKEDELMSKYPGINSDEKTFTLKEMNEYWDKARKRYEEEIAVTNQHKQPETKPGVYIAEVKNASFFKAPNSVINIGTPETFKKVYYCIGDRVKVIGSTHTQQSLRDRGLEKCHNEFGIVKNIENEHVQSVEVFFPYFDTYWGMYPEELKKEFAVGDHVITWDGYKGVVTSHSDGYYDIICEDGVPCCCFGYDFLTYAPEEKKPGDDLTIQAGGTNWGPISTKAPTHKLDINKNNDLFTIDNNNADAFKMNQPIFMDRVPLKDHNEGTHSYSLKFITAEGDDTSSIFDEGHTNTSMKKVFEKCYGPHTTYSATIVLASGRVVNIPNPNEKDWELKNVEKVTKIEPLLLDHAEGNEDVDEFVLNSFVEHEEGRCWLKDMARIIEQKDIVSPFETKFSYVTEIRKYVRKPVIEETYPCCYSTLRNLW